MSQLLTFLLVIINYQSQLIFTLMNLLATRSERFPKADEAVRKEYQPLQVDEPPVIVKLEKLDYQVLIQEKLTLHHKVINPVKRRADGQHQVPGKCKCPRCDAPSDYLYANNGKGGQYLCKVCDTRFSDRNRFSKTVEFRCPHCQKMLDRKKERKGFNVLKCTRRDCPYYIRKLNALTTEERRDRLVHPEKYKLHYITRDFTFEFEPMQTSQPEPVSLDLHRLHVSPYTLGLILTYHVNYGLPARKTSAIMKDIHGLSISHQSVLNYAERVATVIKPYVDHYPYEVSDQFCGDETYLKVKGRWHYAYFFFDAKKKIILSYPISAHRDTFGAIQALNDVLTKLPEDRNGKQEELDTAPQFIVDGNPIYLLAQHFFHQHNIQIKIKQVIGLTNKDPVSIQYRPLKQIIERLNRTFKAYYRNTHGYGTLQGSTQHMVLFVAYFNFLRAHGALEGQTPVIDSALVNQTTMPDRWCRLLKASQNMLETVDAAN